MLLAQLQKLFARSSKKRNKLRAAQKTALRIETLEGRALAAAVWDAPVVPSFSANMVQTSAPKANASTFALAASNTMGNNMATYLRARLGQRIGGGECAHAATAALRFAGADFSNTFVGTNTNDYDWGTQVARLTHGSQLVGKSFQVGDIIQYNNATFSAGGAAKFAQHTQIVSAIDASGRITKVFEQNVNGVRTLRESTVPDLSKLIGGSVTIYRAETMPREAGKLEYTLVNNTAAVQNVTTKIGTFQFSSSITQANTANSFQTRNVTFSGNVTPQIVVGGSSVNLVHGGAFEIYTAANGTAAIRATT